MRAALMGVFAPYARECLREDGCLFFEVSPSVHDENLVTVAECFSSSEAHAAHLRGEAFTRFWERLPDYCLAARFENIYPSRVESDAVRFGE